MVGRGAGRLSGGMNLTRALALTTALGAAVTGGSLYAFSTFVMPALRRLPADQAVAAMQAINVEAPRSLLMLPLVGSAAGCAVVGAIALFRPQTPGRGWLLAGAVAGVLSFLITAAYNVPRNDALAALDPHAAATAQEWLRYASEWTAGNHVRTVAALVAAVALTVGAMSSSGSSPNRAAVSGYGSIENAR